MRLENVPGCVLSLAGCFAGTAMAQHWIAVDGPELMMHGVAYDSGRGRLVAFDRQGGTWESEGTGWYQRPTGGGPPRREWPVLAYDSFRRRTLLFGGTNTTQGSPLGDTWEWDGVEWRQLIGAVAPPGGSSVAMAFDEVRRRMVVFTNSLTFEHDGAQWLQAAPATAPVNVRDGKLAFDPVRGVMLLFGLTTVPVLWQWNGVNWSQLPGPAVPVVTTGGNVAFDRARQRLVVCGTAIYPDCTLEWDGAVWTSTPTPGIGRRLPVVYFDPMRQQVVLQGGHETTFHSDHWAWDGVAWSRIAPERRPFARQDAALGHDPVRGQLVLFGGGTNSVHDDTWQWDGRRWLLAPVQVRPPARRGAAMCVDPTSGRLAMFGGSRPGLWMHDLWHWDGAAWIAATPVTLPQPRSTTALAADTARGRMVLFGGEAGEVPLDDTWEWDGNDWTQLQPALAPKARYRHTLTYDPVRARTVLAGGGPGPLNLKDWRDDTWLWDGSTWQEVAQAARPTVLQSPAATFDAVRGKVLLIGLDDQPTPSFQSWEFDGAAWSQLSVQAVRPGALLRLVHHAARGRPVAFDGLTLIELTPVPATVTSYGSGCGAPVLAARGRPRAGESAFGLETAVQPGAAVLFALAAARGNVLLGNGCALLVQQPVATSLVVADPHGMAVQSIPIPPVPSLRGFALFAQAGVLAPAAPGGFVLTQGLTIQVGD